MKSERQRRSKRLVVFLGGLVILTAAVSLYVGWAGSTAAAESDTKKADEASANPRSEYWRAVRHGVEGYSAVTGPEANVLIQDSGQTWRELRNGAASSVGAWLMAAVLLALGLLQIFKGTWKLDYRTGKTIRRWSLFDRFIHWGLTVTFLLLALTGLGLLFGRYVLMPLLGKEAFGALSAFSKPVHDYVSPFFIAFLILTVVAWMKYNFFTSYDWEWFKKVGGYLTREHVPAGFNNAGEKVWYWFLFLVGLVVVVSGLFLLTPNFEWTRSTMQISNILHIASGVGLICFSFVHIYMATIGNEGTFEAMVGGDVDERWAQLHHDVWYDEVVAERASVEGKPGSSPG
ncbi:MAG: formate dehydrogenase subunit gamma [Polyangiales bacterium]